MTTSNPEVQGIVLVVGFCHTAPSTQSNHGPTLCVNFWYGIHALEKDAQLLTPVNQVELSV